MTIETTDEHRHAFVLTYACRCGCTTNSLRADDVRPFGADPAPLTHYRRPREGDGQRRCWTLTDVADGTAQCWLYNGHPGQCQFSAAASNAEDARALLADKEAE